MKATISFGVTTSSSWWLWWFCWRAVKREVGPQICFCYPPSLILSLVGHHTDPAWLAPRPLSRWKFARKGRRFVTSHSRFALDSMRNHAKNEAPKEDTDTDQNFWMYKTQRKVVPSSRIFLSPCKKPSRNVVTGLFVGKGAFKSILDTWKPFPSYLTFNGTRTKGLYHEEDTKHTQSYLIYSWKHLWSTNTVKQINDIS